jgi:PhoH-like ATPase
MYKVLDTNILLLDAENLINLGKDGSTIVLPETVVDEIDSKKSEKGELGYQVRHFGRLLTKANKVKTIHTNGMVITERSLDNQPIHIVALESYPNFKGVSPSIINDRKIIAVALKYASLYGKKDTQFISNDIMCVIRAESLGLNATDHKEVDKTSFQFTKGLELDDETFRSLHNKPITEVDPTYEPENYNYIFYNLITGQTKLAVIDTNNCIDVLGKTSEQDLRRQDINPLNSGQLFLSHAIQDKNIDLVVSEAAAGTGKTVTAVSNAIKLVRQNSPYNSITYIRASIDDVDNVEAVGFLSGNEEKFAVYLHPLDDALDFIARNRNKGSKLKGDAFEKKISEDIDKIKSDCNIQGMTGLGMRGRTFSNTVAIIDEVQGQSKASLQKMLTRFGKDCKIIIIGSNKQIDNPYVSKYNNGLSVILEESSKGTNEINIHAVELGTIVRSPLAEWSERIFTERK